MSNRYMLKKLATLFLLTVFSSLQGMSITIEECVEKSIEHYPLIRKYGILDALSELELSDINKQWLPKIGMYGQATGQSAVPSYPEALSNVLQQMGQDVKGLSKFQYKVGVDVSQTIWDGGASAARRKVATGKSDLDKAALDVELYRVRERVEDLYFAILLADSQIRQINISISLLESNLDRLRAMYRNGVAMLSDCNMVEAQLLTSMQTRIQSEALRGGLVAAMEIFIGEVLKDASFHLPEILSLPIGKNQRPELQVFEMRDRMTDLSDALSKSALLPKVGFFVQAYYGYPGLDYFRSMMTRDLTFNALAGVKVSWNIDSFYTRRNSVNKFRLQKEETGSERDAFLFNSHIAESQQLAAIDGLRKVMAEDARIIELRENVRKAAESQLQNGVIDATFLLTKISDEQSALLAANLHEIEYIQQCFKLKYLFNQ